MNMNNHNTTFKLCLLFALCCGPGFAQKPSPQLPDIPIEMLSIWKGSRLINGSFDEGIEGWTLNMGAMQPGDEIKSYAELDDSVTHHGSHSLRLSGDQNTTYWYAVVSDPIPIREAVRYRLRGWMKTDDVRQENDQYLNSNLYIQFFDEKGQIVKISNSRVRSTERMVGTQDWKLVDRNVRAPFGSVEARVGCVLTCSGTAWFDDLEFSEGRRIAWRKKETDRFEYFYRRGTPPETALSMNDAYATSIEALLGLKHPAKIKYYIYENALHKLEITGALSETHHEGDIIHALSWDQKHDIVHVLMNQVGRSTPFLEEGIVFYALSVILNKNIHKGILSMVLSDSTLPIQKLIIPKIFKKAPQGITEAHAGSFVSFLVDQYGIDTFKKLYPIQPTTNIQKELPKRFLKLYGMNFDEVETAWKDYIKEMIKPPDQDDQ